MRIMRRVIWDVLPLLAIGFGVVAVAVPTTLKAQNASTIPGASTHGIKHVVYLTITTDPNSPILQSNSNEPQTATLTVKTRISAHSQETSFYGDVPTTVSGFDPVKGSRAQEVWEDTRCHHERGFPKLTVINVDGSITNKQKALPVTARYRWLGLLLPGDEIMPSKRVATGTDDVGPFIETRTATRQSRLFVDMKLYILPCNLQPAQSKREIRDHAVE